jgi:hypothetical protein
MDASATETADFLARFASAVVPRDDYLVLIDAFDPTWFNISLYEGHTLNFHPVDEEGNVGAIFYFADIMIPQPIGELNFTVMRRPPFYHCEIMEPPGHRSLIVLEVHEETPTLTAPGEDRMLVHVEWNVPELASPDDDDDV